MVSIDHIWEQLNHYNLMLKNGRKSMVIIQTFQLNHKHHADIKIRISSANVIAVEEYWSSSNIAQILRSVMMLFTLQKAFKYDMITYLHIF